MTENTIILDIVVNRSTDQRIAQLCADLSTGYFSTNATANNTYTFGWGQFGGTSGNVKLSVGSVGVLLAYNGLTQKIEAIGACDDGAFESLSVSNDTTLQYASNGFTFSVQFHLVDGASIEISVKPGSNTIIAAAS